MSLANLLRKKVSEKRNEDFAGISPFRKQIRETVIQEVQKFKDEMMVEMKEMMKEVLGQEGFNALKGDRGFTPTKGVDYFTSEELKVIKEEIRPQKGKDYFDGLSGRDGLHGKNPSFVELRKMVMGEFKNLKFPEFKAEAFAIAIVKALEKLTGHDKLDYNSLKNIPGVPAYNKKSRRFGGGGGMGDVQHETKSVSSSTTTVTTTFDIAAGGAAIWAYYQGQFIVRGTHYTVSGKTLTLTFTPADNSSIDIVYIRT